MENTALKSGGALYCFNCGTFVLTGVHVEGNVAVNGPGGGVSYPPMESDIGALRSANLEGEGLARLAASMP